MKYYPLGLLSTLLTAALGQLRHYAPHPWVWWAVWSIALIICFFGFAPKFARGDSPWRSWQSGFIGLIVGILLWF
jgi:hypothetical protein